MRTPHLPLTPYLPPLAPPPSPSSQVRIASMMAMPELLSCAIEALKKGYPNASSQLVASLKDFMFDPIAEQV